MNRKSIRALIFGAMIVAMFATMASAAGASNWRAHGTTFTATAGAGTLDFSASRLVCPTASATGHVAGATGPVTPGAWGDVVRGTLRWDGCTLPIPGITIHCAYALTLTATTASNDISGTTTVRTVLHCILYQGSSPCRTIVGAIGGSYTNPVVTTGTARFNLNDSSLSVLTIGSVGCVWPTGLFRYTGGSFHIASSAPSFWAS
jgi:hypothetical protein